jgi:hypothetical protein
MIRANFIVVPWLLWSAGARAQEPLPAPSNEGAEPPFTATAAPARGEDNWPWRPDRAHFTLKLTGGPTYRALLATEVGTADLALAVGADLRRLSIYFTASGAFGETAFGLGVRQLAAGCQLELPIDRIRIGINPRIGYFAVDRVTRDDPFEMLSLSLIGSFSVDLVNTGTFAFALGVAPSLEGLLDTTWLAGDPDGQSAPLFGVGARIEVRWRAPREGDPPRAARFER